jgi:hypothetical protein
VASTPNQSRFIRDVPAPRPRNTLPPDVLDRWRNAAAWTNGDRAKAYAIPGPTIADDVLCAISVVVT